MEAGVAFPYRRRNAPLFPPAFFIPKPNLTDVRFSAGAIPAVSPPFCPAPPEGGGLGEKEHHTRCKTLAH